MPLHKNETNALVNALREQRKERDFLLSEVYIPRWREAMLDAALNSPLIKVILGPRRAGKSRLALKLMQSLLSRSHQSEFIYINFDDTLLQEVTNEQILIDSWTQVYGADCKMILLDEIQNFEGWELLVNKLARRGYQVILTGSNAHLLSKELASHLTGRAFEIEVLPFSAGELAGRETIDAIMTYGGFPDVVLNQKDHHFIRTYLRQLVDSVIYKDIVSRYKIRSPAELAKVLYVLVDNAACKINFKSIAELCGVKSDITAKRYISYFEQAYLIQLLTPYSLKPRERMSYQKKVYLVDNGLLNFLQRNISPNLGRSLEHFVFTELRKIGAQPQKDLFYYTTRKGYEIDFLYLPKTNKPILLQVSWDIAGYETEEREARALEEAAKELNTGELYIITHEQTKTILRDNLKINVLSISDFLADLQQNPVHWATNLANTHPQSWRT
jgi:predicted AAA+ superfamily ATPase